jgi:hypothetical protein
MFLNILYLFLSDNTSDFGRWIADCGMEYVDYQHIPQSAIHNPKSIDLQSYTNMVVGRSKEGF